MEVHGLFNNSEQGSSSPLCLLCLMTLPNESEECVLLDESLVVGAENNVQLQMHLQQMFVLRKILNMPVAWCTNTLRRAAEEENESTGGKESNNSDTRSDVKGLQLKKWFRVCEICTETKVKEAWRLHQKILALQGRMETIKAQIKEIMEKKVAERRLNYEYSRSSTFWIEEEIYEMIFPPVKREVKAVNDEDDAMLADYLFSLKDGQAVSPVNENDSDSDPSYVPERLPKKRGPGRPKGTKSKNIRKARQTPLLSTTKLKRPRGRPKFANKYIKKSKQKVRPLKDCWHNCTKCPSKFRIAELLKSHMEAHSIPSDFTCSECSFPALSGDELQQHITIRHSGAKYTQKCAECPFVGSVRKLKAHILEQHPKAAQSKIEGILCSICSRWCAQKQALSTHQKRMHPELFGDTEKNVQCNICGIIFPSRIRLQHHLKNSHLKATKIVCDTCGKGFWRLKELQRHSIVHNINGKGDWICAICGLDFKYATTLSSHMQQFHSTNDKSNSGAEESSAKEDECQYKCKYCDVKSPFKVVIMRHMKTHKAEMGHGCNLCGKFYTTDQGLKRHLKINHPTDESSRAKCSYCLKEFPHLQYMKMHQLRHCKMKPAESMPETT